ncbi:DUF4142 domain-containing protein [Paractinoplanes globisporus]|uniref:DUF4142 domain-containing protein n=1 Tax=Paractinoplanes globisporus TaxID=113565 RepID=A0ABW6W9T2_9ACTN|nr:DUF4142 domain-containing protein [Actinoplanes globisporus]
MNVGTALLAASVLIVASPVAAHAQDAAASATDRDFVRRVHLAALGVTPASALARDMGASAAVKTLAAQAGAQAAELDKLAGTTAAGLKVALSGPLPADEQSALATLQKHSGSVFDAQFVDFLWTVDSTLLPIATTVHATTRNTAVRTLAERADAVIAAQLPLLEKSGLLHMPVMPSAPASATPRLPGGVPFNQGLVAQTRYGGGFLSASLPVRLGVLVTAVGVATALTWRLRARPVRSRRRRSGAERAPAEALPPARR